MGASYPYWPSFRTVQPVSNIVGAAVSGILADLGVNQIPDYRYTDIPVRAAPRPKIGEPQADSIGFTRDPGGQVKSSLFALVMAPMGAKEIALQTGEKPKDEDGEND